MVPVHRESAGGRPGTALPPQACATFIACVGGNDVAWRCLMPAKALGAKTRIIPEAEMERTLLHQNDDTVFPWRVFVDRNDPDYYEWRYPGHEGTAVWIRPDPPRSVHAQYMREQGILTVSEVDDNYLANPALNIFQRSSGFGPAQQTMHLRSMASMDRIVFSTDWLRDYYLREMRRQVGLKRNQLPEPFVCRNNIDRADWPTPIPRTGPLRVGWMGSPSHVWDVDLAWNALLHASRSGCETYMIGYDPSDPDGGRFPEEQRSVKSKAKIAQWQKVGYTHIPWIAPEEYHRSGLPLDIGLAPVHHNTHCDGKSDCKFLEFSISGAATIAWNTPVYSRTIIHGETGLLVGSQAEAVQAVDLLVKDEALRERLVANAREYVRSERGLDQLRAEWGAAVAP